MDYYTAVTDGGKRKDITYGSYIIYDPYGNILHHKQLVYGYGTSNSAEYLTALHALRKCRELNIDNLVLFTDSYLLVNHVNGNFNINYDHLRELVKSIRQELSKFNSVSMKKVTRNTIKMQLGH